MKQRNGKKEERNGIRSRPNNFSAYFSYILTLNFLKCILNINKSPNSRSLLTAKRLCFNKSYWSPRKFKYQYELCTLFRPLKKESVSGFYCAYCRYLEEGIVLPRPVRMTHAGFFLNKTKVIQRKNIMYLYGYFFPKGAKIFKKIYTGT